MTTISQIFASEAAAVAALKAANAGLTTNPPDPTTHAPGPDMPVHTGADASGARFDLFVTPLTTPGVGAVVMTMPDSSTVQVPAPPVATGQVQVDLFWQGATPPTLTGGTAASAPAISFTPPPAPVAVPSDVPMWAAQAALKAAGKYDAINTAILTMETTNAPVFFAWTMGNDADRNSAFIGELAADFGMTSADIDALFIAADKIANAAG